MPTDNIERAIKRGSGETEGTSLTEMTIEGYGPGGAAVLVQALSDNRNRTLQDVRSIFSRSGGSLGESGCVGWLFDPRGVITVKSDNVDTEELALQAIDAGAEDVKIEDNYVEIYTKPNGLEMVKGVLEQKEVPVTSSELAMVPKTIIELEEKATLQTLKLLDKLEELDEVQHVATNADFPDSVLEKYKSLVG
jgi:YebC/PmpR family DNA-binding regulatory protein